MHFQLYRPCADSIPLCAPRIFAQGRIDYGSGDALRDFLRESGISVWDLPNPLTICLDSGRGSLTGAIRLGEAIRSLRLSTCLEVSYVDSVMDAAGAPVQRILNDEPLCASVCAVAFAAGVSRFAAADAKVAVRRFTELDEQPADSTLQVTFPSLIEYLKAGGVDPAFVDLAASAPRRQRFLSHEQLIQFGLVTPSEPAGIAQQVLR